MIMIAETETILKEEFESLDNEIEEICECTKRSSKIRNIPIEDRWYYDHMFEGLVCGAYNFGNGSKRIAPKPHAE
jgi:hypothetical protein